MEAGGVSYRNRGVSQENEGGALISFYSFKPVLECKCNSMCWKHKSLTKVE